MEKKTPLYGRHVDCGGKIVPFAGYLLPVQYGSGVIAEHMAVRTKAGLFDVSHMGEVLCAGPGALDYLNNLLTNDFTGMYDGQVRYSPMCLPSGGIVDDLLVYRYNQTKYLIVVNASNKDKDFAWMRQNLTEGTEVEDVSDRVAQLALQGPLAGEILSKLTDPADLPQKYYSFAPEVSVGGVKCLVSQTGYTGEFGYEIYLPSDKAAEVWDMLLEAGREFGLIPCGLGARDTLRLEASMPLYGHEMDDTVNPLEAGLGFAVKLKKPDFIGKSALDGFVPQRIRVGLKVTGRGIIREHEPVFAGGEQIGQTTSGTFCPFLNQAVAMALIKPESSAPGTKVEAEVRGRRIEAEVIPLPFYKRPGK